MDSPIEVPKSKKSKIYIALRIISLCGEKRPWFNPRNLPSKKYLCKFLALFEGVDTIVFRPIDKDVFDYSHDTFANYLKSIF